ncbi:MAG: TIGR03960 family B12-binding radical SAM protein, partial [Defluviitaleaceae bacterium]|nr:TIGR03960 family B12-binding radical SAM protein [Defluviitaleaceae bacterium]
IVDFFYIGEAEASLNEVLDLYAENKARDGSRARFLESILSVQGIYVPRFYDAEVSADGIITSFTPNHPLAPGTITKAFAKNLDEMFRPETMLVPLIETVHDRVALEIFRGCMRGCRFCQAGYIHRPKREKSPDSLLSQAQSCIAETGHEEISLVSLSTSDYSRFPELMDALLDEFSDKRVSLSVPSLRIDAFALELMERLRKSGGRSTAGAVTFAPEAGTQRMRDVINKKLTREDIINGCKLAYSGGFSRVKLYYMLGLPTETDDDLLGITELSEAIVDAYYFEGKRPSPPVINVATSCFVPKPFTPFQWEPQASLEEFKRKHILIKKNFRKRQIRYSHHEAGQAVVECALARGDRRLARIIVRAHALGARFDSWSEHFNFERWRQAFADNGIDMEAYASRERGTDEILPWDHISVGIEKSFFVRERAYGKREI